MLEEHWVTDDQDATRSLIDHKGKDLFQFLGALDRRVDKGDSKLLRGLLSRRKIRLWDRRGCVPEDCNAGAEWKYVAEQIQAFSKNLWPHLPDQPGDGAARMGEALSDSRADGIRRHHQDDGRRWRCTFKGERSQIIPDHEHIHVQPYQFIDDFRGQLRLAARKAILDHDVAVWHVP